MLSEVIRYLTDGYTIITPTVRLANRIKADYAKAKLAKGLRVWQAKVFTLEVWLKNKLFYLETAASRPVPLLLSSVQQSMLWHELLLNSPKGYNLLQLHSTIEMVKSAARLCQQYNLNLAQNIGTEDITTFNGWYKAYLDKLRQANWLDNESLLPYITSELSFLARASILEDKLLFVGFDEIYPSMQEFLDELRVYTQFEFFNAKIQAQSINRTKFSDRKTELYAVANSVKQELQQVSSTVSKPLAVVIPDLSEQRELVEDIFTEVLLPDSISPAPKVNNMFNISSGYGLQKIPIIYMALQLLGLTKGKLNLNQIAVLLRTPYMHKAEEEIALRGKMEIFLRARVNTALPLKEWLDVLAEFEYASEFVLAFAEARNLIRENKLEKFGFAEATQFFINLLEILGWPGQRNLSDLEQQAVIKFFEFLQEFANLDLVAGKADLVTMLDRLQYSLGQVIFQPKSEQVRVQILGVLEAAGQDYAALWVTGLNSEIWPNMPKPNPFLAYKLQLAHNIPHSSAQRELAFAGKFMDRFLQSATKLTFSYFVQDGERELKASSLFDKVIPTSDATSLVGCVELHAGKLNIQTEQYTDKFVPMQAKERVKGGASLFKYQAECPFKAFAKLRLSAEYPIELSSGLSLMQRGILLHSVLEHLWQELKTKQALLALEQEKLVKLVDEVVGREVALLEQKLGIGFTCIWELEHTRLVKLILEWLQLEKHRDEFFVDKLEHSETIEVAGIKVRVRVDRIDRDEFGNLTIIDYKTGEVGLSSWFEPRMDAPQLPLYCLLHKDKVNTLTFAKVSRGSCKFIGIQVGAVEQEMLEQINLLHVDKVLANKQLFFNTNTNADVCNTGLSKVEDWSGLLKFWELALSELALEFNRGDAGVRPKDLLKTCRFCDLSSFCRVKELHDRI